jgi:hypothetical protein
MTVLTHRVNVLGVKVLQCKSLKDCHRRDKWIAMNDPEASKQYVHHCRVCGLLYKSGRDWTAK